MLGGGKYGGQRRIVGVVKVLNSGWWRGRAYHLFKRLGDSENYIETKTYTIILSAHHVGTKCRTAEMDVNAMHQSWGIIMQCQRKVDFVLLLIH